jgi:hypothetical protein
MTGALDVDAVLDSMTPAQFDEWAAYDQVEPLMHSERVLALLTVMVNQFMGGEYESIADSVHPWDTQDSRKMSAADFKKEVGGRGKHE